MKFLVALLSLSAIAAVEGKDFVYKRLNKNDTMLLVVDIQVGLFQMARDTSPEEYRNHALAHSAIGPLFDIPTILTTSAQDGPNGPLPKEIIAMHPNAPLVMRHGEVNAWDNAEFRAAVKATGKSQVILAGITTDVCTTFLALSLREAGYEVWANTDASGTFNKRIADEANARMRDAGVTTTGMFAIALELMRDWRSTPGAATVLPFFDQYLPAYGYLARGHGYATQNGTLIPGEAELL
ncbi:Isochorismatase-like protein [Tricharina praecox]|uniref:Isochorismatase-like protein n=1 Tax=Tricharina praecox TaxID=43433 RepID=UPI002220F5E0|nr:Isochorismatase-like protein [Tricharina praecox]KAI5841720.1 Isochorismatase-like protein [Tricharina praecox]